MINRCRIFALSYGAKKNKYLFTKIRHITLEQLYRFICLDTLFYISTNLQTISQDSASNSAQKMPIYIIGEVAPIIWKMKKMYF
jgi:hypothetical protein